VRDSAVQLRTTRGVVLGNATLGAIYIQKGVVDSHFVYVNTIQYFNGCILKLFTS